PASKGTEQVFLGHLRKVFTPHIGYIVTERSLFSFNTQCGDHYLVNGIDAVHHAYMDFCLRTYCDFLRYKADVRKYQNGTCTSDLQCIFASKICYGTVMCTCLHYRNARQVCAITFWTAPPSALYGQFVRSLRAIGGISTCRNSKVIRCLSN